jgi:GH25 family lysozyme M1 (1,4-beta-N-acetylmuramidase)
MTLPFGIDISKYQYSSDGKQKPDFDKINATCDFVAVRAGISWGYTDPWFNWSWQHINKPRLAYHVIYPGEDAFRQMAHFMDIAESGFDEDHDRLVLDVELDHGYPKARITQTVNDCLHILKQLTGRYPIIYSRASWINQFLDVSALPTNLDWWLANYLTRRPDPQYTPEMTPPPTLPNGVNSWLIHQTAERSNGSAVGVVSHYVDCNRFNGTLDELRAYFGLGEETPPEPPTEEKLFDAKVVTTPPNRLKTRYTPAGKERPEADWLQSQAIVPVYETHSTGWWRVADAAWSSATWMQRVDNLPLPPPMSGDYAYFGGVYNQRDIRWAAHALGTKSTIGANGCLMTCASMVCNHFGHASNPLQLNQWLTDNEGYLDGNLFLWAKIEELYPDMKFDGFVYNPTAQQIKAVILAGVMPIMHVDFNDDTPLIEMHWVLGIGVTGADVLIADPWTGTMGRLSEMYPKAVIRYGSYSRRQA